MSEESADRVYRVFAKRVATTVLEKLVIYALLMLIVALVFGIALLPLLVFTVSDIQPIVSELAVLAGWLFLLWGAAYLVKSLHSMWISAKEEVAQDAR